jgi:predicted RNase H-like nuclease (RuvC/YqgF family)
MHSNSFNSSHDQSTDSIGTALQRSGLVANVGDTKSIVLALQALQEKIRKLEQDRNFHQEQCDKAQRSHESYKLEIEGQLDAERSQHRIREQELQDLLARANAERSRLQSTLEESKSDLGHFREELEQMLSSERNQARSKEDQLLSELQQLRSDLNEERKSAEELATAVEQLKREREVIESTNRRLESTVRELITVQNNLMDSVKKGGTTVLNSGVKSMSSIRGRSVHRDPSAANVSTASARKVSVPRGTVEPSRRSGLHNTSSSRFTYMNPTHASVLRDVRCGEIPAPRAATPPRPPSPRPAPRAASSSRGKGSLNTSVQLPAEHMQAMEEVYDEMQAELRELESRYKEAIQDAARNDTSPDVLNNHLNQLMTQIQRKTEQIRLMRQTKGDLTSTTAGSFGERRGGTAAKGVDKALQRNQIVSELRSLFAKSY